MLASPFLVTPAVARYLAAPVWLGFVLLLDPINAVRGEESLQRDYGVSCPELDAVVEIARAIGPRGGVFGCRMNGGGFGGCAMALIATSAAAAITQRIGTEYQRRTGIAATVFASRPADGARLSHPQEQGRRG